MLENPNKIEHKPQLNRVEATRLSWEEMKAKIAKDKDPIVAKRKMEILEALDFDKILLEMPIVTFSKVKRFEMIRGYVFEAICTQEFNNVEENSILANLILNCLRDPHILGLSKDAFKNPDHLGVVVDSETKVAYITGMYEVKLSIPWTGGRVRHQLDRFYNNIQLITWTMNQELKKLEERYGLDILPAGGIVLKPVNEIDQFVVVPSPETDLRREAFEKKKESLSGRGWGLRSSLFSLPDIENLTSSMFAYYEANSKEIDKKRREANAV
jgi:hypothetical protein